MTMGPIRVEKMFKISIFGIQDDGEISRSQ